jgi:tetratricopeptide (TPR) repeat protein
MDRALGLRALKRRRIKILLRLAQILEKARMKNIGIRAMGAMAACALLAFFGFIGRAGAQLGTISFPTSGAAAAQPAFLEGVKDLHSFQFDEAAVAFKHAEQLDPNFALSYWGEAMSYNHPLWSEVDLAAAHNALEKLAPTPEGRAAKTGTEKEKAFLAAAELLFYSPGDKLARDTAYSAAMAKMYDRWPADNEVAIFYALSLLGTVRPADTGFQRQELAASIATKVFQENPNHPGAAHFIIHAYDDPDHAILALPAARAYAKIAPSADHALHMPSHIFLRLGMWQDVVDSNTVAYRAAVALNQRMHLPEGRGDFHALSWLEYGNLMMGKFDEARKNLDLGQAANERNPGNASVHQGYLNMRARYLLETGQEERIAVEDAAGAPANVGADYGRGADNGAWTFIGGLSAVRRNDLVTAEVAASKLQTMRELEEKRGNAFGAKPFAIMEIELRAEMELGRGRKDDAAKIAKEAADIDLTMAAPSGPPEPIKPALELYGDLLLQAGRAKEAGAAYEQQLKRTPNRTPSVKGLAQAKSAQTSAD